MLEQSSSFEIYLISKHIFDEIINRINLKKSFVAPLNLTDFDAQEIYYRLCSIYWGICDNKKIIDKMSSVACFGVSNDDVNVVARIIYLMVEKQRQKNQQKKEKYWLHSFLDLLDFGLIR